MSDVKTWIVQIEAPFSCRDYDGDQGGCIAQTGCYWWSDNTCRNYAEPTECSDYDGDQIGCESTPGCFYWSDGICRNYVEPSYCEGKTQEECVSPCFWYKKYFWEEEKCYSKAKNPMDEYLIIGGIAAIGLGIAVIIWKRR